MLHCKWYVMLCKPIKIWFLTYTGVIFKKLIKIMVFYFTCDGPVWMTSQQLQLCVEDLSRETLPSWTPVVHHSPPIQAFETDPCVFSVVKYQNH